MRMSHVTPTENAPPNSKKAPARSRPGLRSVATISCGTPSSWLRGHCGQELHQGVELRLRQGISEVGRHDPLREAWRDDGVRGHDRLADERGRLALEAGVEVRPDGAGRA